MTKVKVYAPNKGYNGRTGDVVFTDGVAEVAEDARELGYFREAGYGIGGRPDAPSDPEANVQWPDPHTHKDDTFGSPLRDAAVDPLPSDYLPPINAGKFHPHSSKVVAPGIHAVGPAPIRPGEVFVDDAAKQEAAETALAKRVLVEGQPATIVASDEPAGGPLGLSDPGSVEMGTRPENLARGTTAPTAAPTKAPAKSANKAAWVDYAVSRGMGRDEAEDTSLPELKKQYG